MSVSLKGNDEKSEKLLELTVELPQTAWDTLMLFSNKAGLTTSEAIMHALNSFYDCEPAIYNDRDYLLLLDSRIERLEESWRSVEARIRVIEMKKNSALHPRNGF